MAGYVKQVYSGFAVMSGWLASQMCSHPARSREQKQAMKRRTVLKGIGGAIAAATVQPKRSLAELASSPPNVVFVIADQWRAQALGCMGNADIRTPNLDKLASEGVLMRHTFANTPVCCPARSCMLTGNYVSKTGMVANDLRLRESEITLGDLFSKAGYSTGYIGKWHLDGGPRLPGFVPPGRRRHGFQHWAANECNHNYFYNWYFRDDNVPIVKEEYEPEMWTRLAIEFLYESQDKPFFLTVSYAAPHDPYVAPEKYMKMYDAEKLKMRENWVEDVPHGERKDIAGYYAGCTAIDDQLGLLFRAIEELGLKDNTIVMFTSDHGDMLGSQGMILKRKPWEESIRVPGIIRYPRRIPAGRESDALFSQVDYAATLLGLCGLPVPGSMQGTDQSEVLTGAKSSGPEAVHFQIFGPYEHSKLKAGWRGIRTEQYMYARWQKGAWLLYDLKQDPYEMRNLVSDPAYSSVKDDLDTRLQKWMQEIGDSWEMNWTFPIEDGPELWSYKTFYTVPEYLEWAKRNPNLAPGVEEWLTKHPSDPEDWVAVHGSS